MSVYLTCCFYSNQPPSQRNGCKSYALKSVCSTVLVCPQEFPPPGCVSLPDLHVMCQRSGQKWVHLHSELYVYYCLTSKFASLYIYYPLPLPFVLRKIHRLVFARKYICLKKGEKVKLCPWRDIGPTLSPPPLVEVLWCFHL